MPEQRLVQVRGNAIDPHQRGKRACNPGVFFGTAHTVVLRAVCAGLHPLSFRTAYGAVGASACSWAWS